MTNHTPGPWWFAASEEGYVAGAGDSELTKTLSESDARLIAAAPELLDAIKTWPQWIGATDEDLFAWVDKARAAMNKATGESDA